MERAAVGSRAIMWEKDAICAKHDEMVWLDRRKFLKLRTSGRWQGLP